MVWIPSTCGARSGQIAKPFWPLFILILFSLYLFSALIVPSIANASAGLLLLGGWVGLYRLKSNHYVLSFDEKLLLFSFAAFSVVSIVSYFYWPQTREGRMHLEDYSIFLMLIPLYLLLRQFSFNLVYSLSSIAIASIILGGVSVTQYLSIKYFEVDILMLDNPWSLVLRPSGGVNPMRYGAISLILSVICLSGVLLVGGLSRRFKFLLGLSCVMGFVACLLVMARGSLIAIPFLMFTLAFIMRARGSIKVVKIIVLGFMLGVCSLGLSDRIQSTVVHVEQYYNGDSKSPLGARIDMFKAAIILIKEKPVWGYGLNSYSLRAADIQSSTPGMSNEVGKWNNPHNEILQVMVEKGVVGLITLLLLFVSATYFFVRRLWVGLMGVDDRVLFYSVSGLCLLVVYAVAGQTVALFEHDVFNHFFTLVVLFLASQIRAAECVGVAWGSEV